VWSEMGRGEMRSHWGRPVPSSTGNVPDVGFGKEEEEGGGEEREIRRVGPPLLHKHNVLGRQGAIWTKGHLCYHASAHRGVDESVGGSPLHKGTLEHGEALGHLRAVCSSNRGRVTTYKQPQHQFNNATGATIHIRTFTGEPRKSKVVSGRNMVPRPWYLKPRNSPMYTDLMLPSVAAFASPTVR
jgi:hypothetical protein